MANDEAKKTVKAKEDKSKAPTGKADKSKSEKKKETEAKSAQPVVLDKDYKARLFVDYQQRVVRR